MNSYGLAAIDPGARLCAAAFFRNGILSETRELAAYENPFVRADRVVWELPQQDGRSVPAEDLIHVAAAGADLARAIAGAGGLTFRYRPREWKGSARKPQHHRALWDRLTGVERLRIGGAQTLDAIEAACERGARERWKKPGASYYRAAEMPAGMNHNLLDAAALGVWFLNRDSEDE